MKRALALSLTLLLTGCVVAPRTSTDPRAAIERRRVVQTCNLYPSYKCGSGWKGSKRDGKGHYIHKRDRKK